LNEVKEKKKPLTRHGQSHLAEEHEWLARTERPNVLQKISNAAAEGDRSENAEYIYGKKRLREIDRRLRYLDRLLKDAQIILQTELKGEKVCFGSTVEVEDLDGNSFKWTIVGEGESEYHLCGVSWKSPVAKALWGKEVGDEIIIRRPAGNLEVEIVGIVFGEFPAENIRDYKFNV
jgi:transcription elongation factor GreB